MCGFGADLGVFTALRNLKQVTTFGELFLSAFVTAGGIRLMLLHEVRNEEAIRVFFQDVYDLYVKVPPLKLPVAQAPCAVGVRT